MKRIKRKTINKGEKRREKRSRKEGKEGMANKRRNVSGEERKKKKS